MQLEHGDILVAYTDGIVEPENAYGEMFGEERLKDLLVKYCQGRFLRNHRPHHGGRESVDRRRRIAGRYDHGGGAPHMKVLTAGRDARGRSPHHRDGHPGIVLMENAGHRVVEFLAERFAPLAAQRIVVLCGKGNNGGDGLVIARQLYTRFHPAALHVVLLADPEELKGDAAANYRMLGACGCPVLREIPPDARSATLVIDALLGTGISGPGHRAPCWTRIREINQRISAGQGGGGGYSFRHAQRFGRAGRRIRARRCHRHLHRAQAGAGAAARTAITSANWSSAPSAARASLYDDVWLSLVEPAMFRELLAPRAPRRAQGHVRARAGGRRVRAARPARRRWPAWPRCAPARDW